VRGPRHTAERAVVCLLVACVFLPSRSRVVRARVPRAVRIRDAVLVQNINSSVMPGMGLNRDKNAYMYPEFQVCRASGRGEGGGEWRGVAPKGVGERATCVSCCGMRMCCREASGGGYVCKPCEKMIAQVCGDTDVRCVAARQDR